MKRLGILGASGHGKVVADAALCAGWDELVFFDDEWPRIRTVGPWTIAGVAADLIRSRADFDGAVVAIGNNRTRIGKQRELVAAGVNIASVVHPAAVVSRFATIGLGSVVFAGAIINPFAILGSACIVNTGATVDHDCVLADGVHISPGAHLGGAVQLGERTWIGIGAAVRHGISIGADVIVGAGAAVIKDIVDKETVTGVPAQPMNKTHVK